MSHCDELAMKVVTTVDLTILVLCIFIYMYEALACDKASFIPVSGARHPARVIQRSEAVTVGQCKRLCRMYAECYGFNMKWSDAVESSGSCEVLHLGDRTDYGTPGYTNHSGCTYYGK